LAITALPPATCSAFPGSPLAIRNQTTSSHYFNALPMLLEAFRQGKIIDTGRAHAVCGVAARCQVGLASQQYILTESERARKCRVTCLCWCHALSEHDFAHWHEQRHGR